MESLRESILRIMEDYHQAQREPFKEHPIGKIVRQEIPNVIYNSSQINHNKYMIKASVGQGNWANIPWIAIMDKSITTSTQRGYYLVYLFSEDMRHVYLALAQGVTESTPEQRAAMNKNIRNQLNVNEDHIVKANDFLLGESDKAKQYKQSTALYIEYSYEIMPNNDRLLEDLQLMLQYYEDFIEASQIADGMDVLDKFVRSYLKQQVVSLSEDILDQAVQEVHRLFRNNELSGSITSANNDPLNLIPKLPFTEITDGETAQDIRLKKFTTAEMPEATYEASMEMLSELMNDDYKASEINHVFNQDKTKRLKSRTRQGLRLLGYLDRQFELTINDIPDIELIQNKMAKQPLIGLFLNILKYTEEFTGKEKRNLLKRIVRETVVSSTTNTPITDSVNDYRTNNILGWLKSVGLIDDKLNVIHNEVGSSDNNYLVSNGASTIHSDPTPYEFNNENDLIDHIHNHIESEGFYYKKDDVKNLYLSLKTKPFVILSGISGTGKTKIVEKFAASLGATDENGRFQLIPVRPDWSDGSDLIGYEDIKGEFQEGPLTQALRKAMEHPDVPYFILLDEMNLARVEYYFSDLLSIMESRKWQNHRIVTSPVLDRAEYPRPIIIPENVYIIGTVNMDETTHPFSAKVLDRANTIEFNDVVLDFFPDLTEKRQADIPTVSNDQLKSQFLTLKDAFVEHEDLVRKITENLVQINRILEKNNQHFGYRVRDEISFYMIYNAQSDLMSEDEAFDLQLLQKILPKLAGSDGRTAELIEGLFEFCTGQVLGGTNIQPTIANAPYPKSAEKLADMYMNQEQNGFTSFWLA